MSRATEGQVNSDGGATLYGAVRARCLKDVDVFVIAGGLGTRLGTVLGNVPKLLAPISGRPYLVYLVDWLRRFGAGRIILGLGHQARAFALFLGRNGPLCAGLPVETAIEPQQLGTAGAIRFARRTLRSDPVLIM